MDVNSRKYIIGNPKKGMAKLKEGNDLAFITTQAE